MSGGRGRSGVAAAVSAFPCPPLHAVAQVSWREADLRTLLLCDWSAGDWRTGCCRGLEDWSRGERTGCGASPPQAVAGEAMARKKKNRGHKKVAWSDYPPAIFLCGLFSVSDGQRPQLDIFRHFSIPLLLHQVLSEMVVNFPVFLRAEAFCY